MNLKELKVLVRGAGEMASGVGLSLNHAHFQVVFTEIETPLSIRRGVSFCEALYRDRMVVEDGEAVRAEDPDQVLKAWSAGKMAVLVDPDLKCLPRLEPQVVVDAVLAKKNLGLTMNLADLIIALGPGFTAGQDAHVVVETNRGHNLGRLIYHGQAEPDTGVPGEIAGETGRRVLRAPAEGGLETDHEIGDRVRAGEIVARVAGRPVRSELEGVLRGLIRPGTLVRPGLKIGDVDPRGRREFCWTVSDKARAVGGAVLEAILRRFNQ